MNKPQKNQIYERYPGFSAEMEEYDEKPVFDFFVYRLRISHNLSMSKIDEALDGIRSRKFVENGDMEKFPH